jgi:hypothetical protein
LTEEAPTAKKPKLLQQALEEAQQEVATTTLVNTHPTNVVKKINWDLKRDIEPQLDRLERQTQLCIVDLLKERLAWRRKLMIWIDVTHLRWDLERCTRRTVMVVVAFREKLYITKF